MLIEDDPDDVFLFERALDRVKAGLRQDVALEHAGDGLDAAYRVSIEDLTNRLPDVLVLDLNAASRRISSSMRCAGRWPWTRLPVFVLTTSTERPVHEAALARRRR